jgi:cytochrome c biogenesis protein CcmG/thiol:disulfide interchange protein DsbE
MGRTILLIFGTLVLLALLAVMAVNLAKVESVELQGRQAPNFTLTLFDQFEQDQLTLSNLRGQVIVVNFWASWCVECYKEAALLEQAWQDHKDRGVVFIGVDYLDTDKEALAYMEKYGITYPSGPDWGSKVSRDYAITGVPETFFIDRDGNIVHVQIGPIEKEQLYSLLTQLIAQSAQGS